jgi:ATP-binding cassette subfamily B protein
VAGPGTLTAARLWLSRFLRPVAEGDGLVSAAPRVPLRDILRRLGPELRPFRLGIAVLLLVATALPAVETVEIWLFQRVVDDVLVPVSLEPLLSIAMLYVVLSLASGLLGWVDIYVSTWVGEHLTLSVRNRMLARIHQAPVEVIDRSRLGDLLTRLTSDARSVETLLLGGVVDGVGALARLFFFAGALLLLDWQLALVSFVVAPLFWWTSRRFGRRLKVVSRERRRRAGSMASVAEESVAMLPLVQLHGREREEQGRVDREGRAIVVAELAAARIRAAYPIVIDLIELVGLLAVIGLGTWALADGRLTLGGLLVFLTYLSQLYRPIRELGDLGVVLVSATAGVDRVIEVLDLPVGLPERPDPVVVDPVHGIVQFEGVGFTYLGARQAAVSDLSFTVRPGRLTALTGSSGAGKSTAVRLVARLIDPEPGRVLLDGVDLRDMPVRQVRDSVAVLLQEAPILDASVRDNVAFARPDANDAQVWAALRSAGIDGVISALPEGLNSRVGRAGHSLSGGQRQRIALARALLVDARVLVLDEPTTGLDAPMAARLLDTLVELARERTVLIASHDERVLAAADEVLTLHAPSRISEPTR